ncbi:MAG TPA: peptidoglycan-binding domain-containing protein [Candidatus Nanoarchaeia archaeon]|nr:peptidoglycan-binding domain-containing protein [Candidatus Nanoarchaeia archaeon]
MIAANSFLRMLIILLLLPLVCSQEQLDYSERIRSNEGFTLDAGHTLSSQDLQTYSGTMVMREGSTAEMPSDFQGNIVFTQAKITLFSGEVLEGSGTCQKSSCTLLKGTIRKGEISFVDSNAVISEQGISILSGSLMGGTDVDVLDISHVIFTEDGKASFTVKKGSEVGGWEINSAGRITFDPLTRSLTPFMEGAQGEQVFSVRPIPGLSLPLTFIREGADIEIDQGMFLTQGSVAVHLRESEPCSGNCLLLSDKSIRMRGEGYWIRFNEENQIANALSRSKALELFSGEKEAFLQKYGFNVDEFNTNNRFWNALYFPPATDHFKAGDSHGTDEEKNSIRIIQRIVGASQDGVYGPQTAAAVRQWQASKGLTPDGIFGRGSWQNIHEEFETTKAMGQSIPNPRTLELSPRTGGTIEIENRFTSSDSALASRLTVIGDDEHEVWAEIRNGGVSLQAGKEGIHSYRIPRRGQSEFAIPLELNILDASGQNLISSTENSNLLAAITERGTLRFATSDASVNMLGNPVCSPSSSMITGNSIRDITGYGISISTFGCKDNFFRFESEYSSRAAILTSQEEHDTAKIHTRFPAGIRQRT